MWSIRLMVISIALAAVIAVSDDARRLLPRQPGRPKPGDKMSPGPPSPVGPMFQTNCTQQQGRHRHDIRCEPDGTFSRVQCMGPKCFCVTPDTGERINSETFSRSRINSMPCSTVAPDLCSNRKPCKKVCLDGYMLDRNMCQTCMCRPRPPVQRCQTFGDLVVNEMCSCQCVVEPVTPSSIIDVTTPPAPTDLVTVAAPSTTRAAAETTTATSSPVSSAHRAMEASMQRSVCPVCNRTCSSLTPDSSCAVTTQEQCNNGTTLVSVGRRGRPECVPDLSEQERCMPEMDPMVSKLSKLSGASKRSRARKVNEVFPPCAMNFVCKAIQPRDYVCTRENPAAPCVAARRDNPSLRCDPRGNYHPVQCREVTPVSEGTATPTAAGTMPRRGPGFEECRCVYPNGTTIAGSTSLVMGKMDRPHCHNLIKYEDCSVSGLFGRGNKRYRVSHGETYFDATNCRTCVCQDGNETALCSSSTNCSSVGGRGSGPANCQLSDGTVVQHGVQITAGCEKCGCRDGRLRCTKKRSKCKSSVVDACDRCKEESPRQVCGPDGRNHRTHCSAVQCAAIPAVDLQEGPCRSQNACEEFPCAEDEVCINKKGTVACMGRRGCKSHQLRTCLNVSKISCPVVNRNVTTPTTTDPVTANPTTAGPESVTTDPATVAMASTTVAMDSTTVAMDSTTVAMDSTTVAMDSTTVAMDSTTVAMASTTAANVEGSGSGDLTPLIAADDADSTLVCGTDGQTYDSICHLIQTSINVQVLYAGDCNDTECDQGEVCGTDGFTYGSLCELQNQAAVRVQYPGPCLESGSDLCSRVATSNRCTATPETCDVLVNVPDSCCPVCGGAIELVIDVDSLTDASESNPDISTVDAFTISLLDVKDFQNVESRCDIEPTLNDVGNLVLVFEAKSRRDSRYCYEITMIMERLINGDSSARSKRQASDDVNLPQEYAFVMAASVSTQTESQTQAPATVAATGTNGNAIPLPMGKLMGLLLAFFSVCIWIVG